MLNRVCPLDWSYCYVMVKKGGHCWVTFLALTSCNLATSKNFIWEGWRENIGRPSFTLQLNNISNTLSSGFMFGEKRFMFKYESVFQWQKHKDTWESWSAPTKHAPPPRFKILIYITLNITILLWNLFLLSGDFRLNSRLILNTSSPWWNPKPRLRSWRLGSCLPSLSLPIRVLSVSTFCGGNQGVEKLHIRRTSAPQWWVTHMFSQLEWLAHQLGKIEIAIEVDTFSVCSYKFP